MSAIKDAIELIAADRRRWSKKDQEACHRAWKVAFEKVPSDRIREAARRFLKHGRGIPTAQKLQRIMDTIKRENAAAARALNDPAFDDLATVEAERRRIAEDLERNGDPIADYLEARGYETVRSRKRREQEQKGVAAPRELFG